MKKKAQKPKKQLTRLDFQKWGALGAYIRKQKKLEKERLEAESALGANE